ncbi:MAG: polysaccharide pyruvyl transferase family protein, partial [Thioalkalivibrio sp.]|nr:polysaccharide pyruvyl transferase family protein [Thioalkalivibrio sp.]
IVRALPNNPIVQLPQSIEFRDSRAERDAARVFDRHPRLILLLRDHRSLERARHIFEAPTYLCPDGAFCLQPFARPKSASVPVLALLREDQESSGPHAVARLLESGGRVVDWLAESPSADTERNRALGALVRAGGLRGRLAEQRLRRAWERAAAARVARGLHLLSDGYVVVTDRLHAHILCVMAEIPHVLIPDRFGKVDAFIGTWTAGAPQMRRADGAEEAWAIALEMVDGKATG